MGFDWLVNNIVIFVATISMDKLNVDRLKSNFHTFALVARTDNNNILRPVHIGAVQHVRVYQNCC